LSPKGRCTEVSFAIDAKITNVGGKILFFLVSDAQHQPIVLGRQRLAIITLGEGPYMRLLISIGLCLVSSSGAYCQHRGGFSPIAPPVVRPVPPMSVHPPISPGGVRTPVEWWRCKRSPGMSETILPYFVPYPVYSNGEYYPDNPSPFEQQVPPVMGVMPPQQPVQPVITNQYVPDPVPARPPTTPSVQVYQVPASQRSEPIEPQRPTIFIALKDGWVYTASDYWVENGTLHYIAARGKHNQVSLDLVDRQTTARLNHGGEFQLPPQ